MKVKFKYLSLLVALTLITSLVVACNPDKPVDDPKSTSKPLTPANLTQEGVVAVDGVGEVSMSFNLTDHVLPKPPWKTKGETYFAKLEGDKSTLYMSKYSADKAGYEVSQTFISDKFKEPVKLMETEESIFDPKFYLDDSIMSPQMYIARNSSGNFDLAYINSDFGDFSKAKIKDLAVVNTSSNERSPFMSGIGKTAVIDGEEVMEMQRTLYFVSDRPGGKGGYDIYSSKATFNDMGLPKKFEEPKPIDILNTEGNEDSLFISTDGTLLYFSRDGDIWASSNFGSGWSEPQKMSSQINTEAKEMYPAISPDRQKLYFSREESDGTFNMYELKYRDIRFEKQDDK